TGYLGALRAIIALRRRPTQRGSWLETVSLSQTSMWYQRLGHDLDRARASGEGDVAPLLEERDTPYGRMRQLRPALRMSETQPRWELPTSPLGSGDPVWS
ncbi:MAG: CoA transferase, partial [Dehalococcoidia bacterium]